MKKKIVLLFTLIMTVGLTFGLTACGGDSSNESASTETEAVEETTEAEEYTVADYFIDTITWIGEEDGYGWGEFEVTEETQDFIRNHEEFFQYDDTAGNGYDKDVEEAVGFKQLDKNIGPYLSRIVHISSGEVIQIFEDDSCVDDGEPVITQLLVSDNNSDGYFVVYYMNTVDIYEGDHVSFYALPLGSSCFENTGGGTTNVVNMLGCKVSK
ncbi:MAG: hypothetical protein MSA09_00475 [Lachnospiraceae bacterium]|nr:hypothetical protein [Lachnospiraceae bacterium]